MTKTILKIDGMMCSMCEAHMNETIRKAVPGAQKVVSSHTKGESSFVSEEPVDPDVLEKAIHEIGYEMKDMKTEPYEKKRGLFGIFG